MEIFQIDFLIIGIFMCLFMFASRSFLLKYIKNRNEQLTLKYGRFCNNPSCEGYSFPCNKQIFVFSCGRKVNKRIISDKSFCDICANAIIVFNEQQKDLYEIEL